jgi:hypothetical protein
MTLHTHNQSVRYVQLLMRVSDIVTGTEVRNVMTLHTQVHESPHANVHRHGKTNKSVFLQLLIPNTSETCAQESARQRCLTNQSWSPRRTLCCRKSWEWNHPAQLIWQTQTPGLNQWHADSLTSLGLVSPVRTWEVTAVTAFRLWGSRSVARFPGAASSCARWADLSDVGERTQRTLASIYCP